MCPFPPLVCPRVGPYIHVQQSKLQRIQQAKHLPTATMACTPQLKVSGHRAQIAGTAISNKTAQSSAQTRFLLANPIQPRPLACDDPQAHKHTPTCISQSWPPGQCTQVTCLLQLLHESAGSSADAAPSSQPCVGALAAASCCCWRCSHAVCHPQCKHHCQHCR